MGPARARGAPHAADWWAEEAIFFSAATAASSVCRSSAVLSRDRMEMARQVTSRLSPAAASASGAMAACRAFTSESAAR